jgi:hypothetical protein
MAQVVLYGPNGLPLNPQMPMIVDPTFYAGRMALKPHEYQFPGFTGGHYRAVGLTSAIANAANAVLLDFFFSPSNNNILALIKRIRAHLYVATAVTAQRLDPLVCTMQRGYTAQSVTNATALVLTANNAKMRTTPMGTPIAKIGMANAAAGITGGTKTADANPFGIAPLSGSAAIAGVGTGSAWVDLYKAESHGDHPPLLMPNEGFTVANGATAVATGTVITAVEVEWLEALQF